MKKVIIITGPTAVGKTKLAIEIADRFNTPLINADVYQMYKGLSILTAKPRDDELKKVPHLLLGVLEQDEKYSIYDYQKKVRSIINDIDIPILVGGSGLYIDSVIYNYKFIDTNYHFDDTNYTNEELYNILKKLDSDAASKIPVENRRRIIRQIELFHIQEKEERSKKNELYYDALIIALSLDREILYRRINERVNEMIQNGLIDEVKENPNLSNTQLGKAIGYEDTINYLNNQISMNELIDNIQKKSRHYAKRQITWYKSHQNITYLNVDLNNFNQTINEAINVINDFLKK